MNTGGARVAHWRRTLCATLSLAAALLAACSKTETHSQTTAMAGAGAGGTPAMAGNTGNAGGQAGAAGGAAGAAGGEAGAGGVSVVPRECQPTVGVNDAQISVRRPDLSTRIVGVQSGESVIRIARDPLTGLVYYLSQLGPIYQLDLETGVSTEANMGHTGDDFRGMTFGSDGTLYLLSHVGFVSPQISVVIQKGVPAAGGTRTWTTLATSESYPAAGSAFDHRFAGLVLSPDEQWLYFGSGSRTDHGELQAGLREVPLSAGIFRIPANADNLLLANDTTALQPYVYAAGMRNPFDMEFTSAGELFATENGPDIDFPEEINWVRQGQHYGFPWRFAAQENPVLDPNYDPTGDTRLHAGYQAIDVGSYVYDANFPAPPADLPLVDAIVNHGPDGDHFRDGPASDVLDASDMGQSLAGLTAHRSPLGIAFDKSDSMCGDYRGAGFVLSFGPVLDVMGDPGGDLLMLRMTRVGDSYEMNATQLVASLEAPVDSLLIDNKLYVISFLPGANIYEITFPLPVE